MDKAIQEEIQAYLRKSERRLKVAKHLHEQEEYEDAVSRAYYSIYHAAQAALLTEGLRADTHRGLAMLFGLHLVESGKVDKKFAKYIRNVRDDRETSDYEVYSGIDRETSETALREATEFFHAMKAFVSPNAVL